MRNLLNLTSTGYYIIFLKCTDPFSQNLPDIIVLMVFIKFQWKSVLVIFFPLLTEAVIYRNAPVREGVVRAGPKFTKWAQPPREVPYSTVLTKYIK